MEIIIKTEEADNLNIVFQQESQGGETIEEYTFLDDLRDLDNINIPYPNSLINGITEVYLEHYRNNKEYN